MQNTRDKLLDVAESLFSKNGFYGTSINDVATQVNVSKQALLHYFPSKEKLYAAVLKSAVDDLLKNLETAKKNNSTSQKQLQVFIIDLLESQDRDLIMISLFIRDLLENRERTREARKWFLRPFLDELVSMVDDAQTQGYFLGVNPIAFIFDILGAVQYYLISTPTLKKLYNEEEFAQVDKAFKLKINQRLSS